MKRQGTIIRFDAERGFGFLHARDAPADVFFHVRDFDRRDGPPAVGQAVDFEEIHVGGKGPRAMAVRPAGRQALGGPARWPQQSGRQPVQQVLLQRGAAHPGTLAGAPTASLPLFAAAMLVEIGLLAWCVLQARLPVILLAVGLLLNLATFWIYWQDKHAARQRAWRVRENSLHVLALAGGWPAAWWAQQLLRHKSRKPSFRHAYLATVVGHLGLLAAFAGWPMLR